MYRLSSSPKIKTLPCFNHNIQAAAVAKRQVSLAGWYSKRKRNRGWSDNKKSNDSDSVTNNCSKKSNIVNTSQSDIAANKTNSNHRNNKFSPRRFFNPWEELANIIPSEEMLSDKVESTTRTFGIVAALMGSLAAGLLTYNTYDGYDTNKEREPVRNESNNPNNNENKNRNNNTQQPFSPLPLKRRNTISFIEHVTFTHHISGTSLLVSWGIPGSKLDDIYTACCAGSFYSGVLTTVLSSVINAWLAATPPGGIRSFVRIHSWYIVALPALLGVSTSLAGIALFIGLDREHGTPVSFVGLGGTLLGGAALGLVTGRGWIHTYKSLTEAVLKRGGKGGMH